MGTEKAAPARRGKSSSSKGEGSGEWGWEGEALLLMRIREEGCEEWEREVAAAVSVAKASRMMLPVNLAMRI